MTAPIPTPQQQAKELRDAVQGWLEKNQWKGYDPFDGLASPLTAPLVGGPLGKVPGAKLARLSVLQAVKRAPVNLRKVLMVKPLENAMSLAVGALGAAEALQRGESGQGGVTVRRIERMMELRDPKTGLWGYPFPWQALAFYVPAGEPNLVISSVCLRALAEAIRLLPVWPEVDAWKQDYLRALEEMKRLFWREKEGFFSYVQGETVLVHNANLFGAEGLFSAMRIGLEIDHGHFEMARTAVYKTLNAQEKNGRWSYGTNSHHEWCDNFHTAYNLVSLSRMREAIRGKGYGALEKDLEQKIIRGLDYYLENGFTRGGMAKYYDKEVWPFETHSAAAALICFKEMVSGGFLDRAKARDLSARVLIETERELYLGDGKFAYRRWRKRLIKQVFTRWTQAWMYLGLEASVSLLA